MAHDVQRALIDAHFAGRISREDERLMREHYNDCERCRRYYARHLVLAELDPVALDARRRIGAGLGLRLQPAPWRAVQALLLGFGVALAGAWLLLVPPQPEFQARGVVSTAQGGLRIYRFEHGGNPALVGERVAVTDELGFAYRNPGHFSYLSICGVDEHGRVYWYHPGWTDAARDPQSVAIEGGGDFRELPEAIQQDIDTNGLQIVGMFTRAPLHVRELESKLNGHVAGDPTLVTSLQRAYPDASIVSRNLDVKR